MEPFERLEYEWAVFHVDRGWDGCRNDVVACSSGTAALHLALESLRLPGGSQVIVPDYTMVACARAVTLAGLVPHFVDVRGSDLLLDEALAEKTVTYKTSAVMAVHTYGRVCNMEAIHKFATRYSLAVIEDCAEAHGVVPHPLTDATCWSFYKNKVVAGEEGGAVMFRNPEHSRLARQLRCLGFTSEHDYTHVPRGHNYRMSNAHAGLILDSLRRHKPNLYGRRVVEQCYHEQLAPLGSDLPPRSVPWVYDLRLTGMTAEQQNQLVRALRNTGIQARHGFKPMSGLQEYRNNHYSWRPGNNPESYRASTEVIYLPCGPDTPMTDARRAVEVLLTVTRSWQ